MRRVLITGASGAIGCHVLAHLMENTDWEAVLTDSFGHGGHFDRITTICTGKDWESRLSIVKHDLTAPFTKREIDKMGKIDYIVNLASLSDVQASIDDPVSFVKNNVDIMLNMVEYARVAKPEAFIHFSTDEVYGPTPKDSGGHEEWSPIVPSNPYSGSKACQEAIAVAWWRCYGVPIIITNTMNNFGEMQGATKFPAMIQSKIEKGETIKVHASSSGEIGTRYYIHSRNSADAVLFILNNVKPILHVAGEIDRPVRLNIVGDKQVDNLQLVSDISGHMDKKAEIEMSYFHESNPGHDLHYGLNGDKLSKLGWKSPITYEDSLKSTIEWQKNHPEWL